MAIDVFAIVEDKQTITEEMVNALDLEQAEAMYDDLRGRVMDIDEQLARRAGERASRNKAERDAYWEWKGRAGATKIIWQRALVRLKARVRSARQQSAIERIALRDSDGLGTRTERLRAYFDAAYARMSLDPNDATAILAALFDTMQYIVDAGAWQPSDDEKAVLAAAQTLLEAEGIGTR